MSVHVCRFCGEAGMVIAVCICPNPWVHDDCVDHDRVRHGPDRCPSCETPYTLSGPVEGVVRFRIDCAVWLCLALCVALAGAALLATFDRLQFFGANFGVSMSWWLVPTLGLVNLVPVGLGSWQCCCAETPDAPVVHGSRCLVYDALFLILWVGLGYLGYLSTIPLAAVQSYWLQRRLMCRVWTEHTVTARHVRTRSP